MAAQENITEIFNGLADLAECYSALLDFMQLAQVSNIEISQDKICVFYSNFNKQFTELLDKADGLGLLS